jgi:hypothetical protein
MSVPHREGGQQADRKQDECRASQEEEDLLFEGTPPSLAAKKAGVKGFMKGFNEGEWQHG